MPNSGGIEMFRPDYNVILGSPDDNRGAAEIQTPWSMDEISAELNVPIVRATNKI